MKLIIEIDDKVFEEIKKSNTIKEHLNKVDWSIRNATPLPKGHGRLIDAEALKTLRMWALVSEKNAPQNEISFAPLVCVLKEDIDNAMTIVEADKENDNGL